MAGLFGTVAPSGGLAPPNETGEACLTATVVGAGADPDGQRAGAHLVTQQSALAYLRAEAGALALDEERCTADECPHAAMVFAAFVRGFDAALSAVDDALAELETTWSGPLGPYPSETTSPQ
jgi:hypothetical protein